MKTHHIVIFSVLIAFGALTAANAQSTRVYTWVDGNGVRHYTQTPPKSGKYQERNVRSQGVADEAAASNPNESVSCRLAKQNLTNLNATDARLMIDRDGDGKRELMDETEKLEARDLADRQVKAFCTKNDGSEA